MIHLDLFSGIGGFSVASEHIWPGIEHVFCDNNRYCQELLKLRFKGSRIYGDIRKLSRERFIADTNGDGRGTGKNVFLLTGGFPCQPFSQAGQRKGKNDDRYLWPEMLRIIQEFKPEWIIAENVAGILSMAELSGQPDLEDKANSSLEEGQVFIDEGQGTVEKILEEIEDCGYDVQPYIIPACAVNAPHRRDRVWIVARNANINASNPRHKRPEEQKQQTKRSKQHNTDATYSPGQRMERGGRSFQGKPQNIGYSSWERRRWDENWIEVAQRLCKFYDGISSGLAGHLKHDETYGIMGFILTIREAYYAKTVEKRDKALSVLREAIGAKTVSEFFGRFQPFYEKKVLQCSVHGKSYDEREKDEIGILEISEQAKEELLRKMRKERKLAYSSQGYGLEKQCSCKFDDIVRELSSEIALGEWEKNSKEAQNILFNLWKESRGERFLHEPLQALYEIWKSVTNKEIGSFRRHYYKRDSGLDLPNLKFSKSRHRQEKLKALGNAIVPQVAIEIMKAIKEAKEQK